MVRTVGIDVGSSTVKAVVMQGEGQGARIVGRAAERIRRRDPVTVIRHAFDTALEDAGTRADELEQKVWERTKEVRETQLKVVQRLGRAGEFRDNETGAHVIRMSQSCRLLALAHGMNEVQADMILNASPMHDVGKIGVRDDILLKPGRLTAEEFAIMKTHVQIGADIIGDDPSELLAMARRITRLSATARWPSVKPTAPAWRRSAISASCSPAQRWVMAP